jgi:hypothetical protein
MKKALAIIILVSVLSLFYCVTSAAFDSWLAPVILLLGFGIIAAGAAVVSWALEELTKK